jgi:hypothetical protein
MNTIKISTRFAINTPNTAENEALFSAKLKERNPYMLIANAFKSIWGGLPNIKQSKNKKEKAFNSPNSPTNFDGEYQIKLPANATLEQKQQFCKELDAVFRKYGIRNNAELV